MSDLRTTLTDAGALALKAGIEAYTAGDTAAAKDAFATVFHVEPNNPTATYQMGMCLYREGKHADAIPYFAKVIGLRPQLPDPWFRYAACSLQAMDHDNALRGYRRALALAPDRPEHHHGLATLMTVLGDNDAALAGFRRARELKPDYAWAELSEAFVLLGMGRWAEGWPLMEARRRIGKMLSQDARPVWDGRELDGQSILLRSEQGIGDMINMARYVPPVQARGGRVILETRPELLRLFATLGADQLVQLGDELPATDWQDHMMSMPLRFGTTPEDAAWSGAYLGPNIRDVAAWPHRLMPFARPRIGLCWSGGHLPWVEASSLAINARRSLTAETLFPLLGMPGVSWIALQPALAPLAGVFDTRPFLDDMADTAALISCLDLVITVDTSIAHLAGAMGRPVWLIDRLDKCWRWLPGREDSPWYPTMRIFRQERLGDWPPVIERVRAALVEAFGRRESH